MEPTRDWNVDERAHGFSYNVPSDAPAFIRVRFWSTRLDEALEETRVSAIEIDTHWQEDERGLGFLLKVASQIRSVGISSEHPPVRLDVLERLPNLEKLTIRCSVRDLDFSKLTELRDCILSHPGPVGNVSQAPGLVSLALFSSKIRDIEELCPLRLQSLDLRQTQGITSLNGIERFPLRELIVMYLNRLQSFEPVGRLSKLRRFELEGSKRALGFESIGNVNSLEELIVASGPPLKSLEFLRGLRELWYLFLKNEPLPGTPISAAPLRALRKLRVLKLGPVVAQMRDPEMLAELKSVEQLSIDRARELKSLAFLSGLKNLREFSLYRTKVRDGNMQVLLDLPQLQRVWSIHPNAKHYTHTGQEIDAVLGARWPNRASLRPMPRPSVLSSSDEDSFAS